MPPARSSRPIHPFVRFCEPLEPRCYFSAAISFANHVDFASGTNSVALVATELNGDGKIDLAVADRASETVNIFFGNGDGSFSTGPVLTVKAPPVSIIAADFNGDGQPDLAVGCSPGTNTGTTVTVFLNTGNNTFGLGQSTTVAQAGNSNDPIALTAADFNKDGNLDVAATDFSGGNVVLLLGNGLGRFQTPISFAVGSAPRAITALDFNHDGNPDLAFTALGTNSNTGLPVDQVTLLQGSGTGTFSSGGGVQLPAAGSQAIVAADLTGNSLPDLITGNTDGSASVLLNGGTQYTLNNTVTLSAASTSIAVADFDLDGNPDFVSADGGADLFSGLADVTVAQASSGGAFSGTRDFATAAVPSAVAVADVNDDGKPDVVTANGTSGTVSILLNTTIANLPTTTTLSSDTNPASYGSAVSLTASVTGPSNVSLLPGGTVNFLDGSTLLDSESIPAGSTQAVFVDSALGVGNHSIRAQYVGNSSFAGSTSPVVVQTISPSGNNGPDLVGTFVPGSLPSVFVPGEKGIVKVRITNQGNFAAAGVLTDQLYLSLDGTLDSTDIPVSVTGPLARFRVNIKASGGAVVLPALFTVPSDLPAGDYMLLASLNSTGAVPETITANDVAISAPYSAVDEFGHVGGRGGVVLSLPDPDGTLVTYRLIGPGTGTVLVADTGDSVTITGAGPGSLLLVTGKGGNGRANLYSLQADSTLGAIIAPTADLTGAVNLSGGAGRIVLGDITYAGTRILPGISGSSSSSTSGTIDIGAGPVASIKLGNLGNGIALSSASAIRSLNISSWSGDGSADQLSAPSIGILSCAGNFDPSVLLNGTNAAAGIALRAALIHGRVSGTWSISGSVGRIDIGGVFPQSNVFGAPQWIAGIGGSLQNLTDAGDLIGNVAASRFGAVLIRGNLTGDILAGANFGADGRLGGGDDAFGVGTINLLRVMGSVTSSIVAAGLSPVDASDLLGSGAALLPGGSIKSLFVAGTVDSQSRFLSATLPPRPRIGGVAIPLSDHRFQLG